MFHFMAAPVSVAQPHFFTLGFAAVGIAALAV